MRKISIITLVGSCDDKKMRFQAFLFGKAISFHGFQVVSFQIPSLKCHICF